MVGPVFALELLRERRRVRWFRLLGWAYAALLGLEILAAWLDTMGGGHVYEPRALFLSAGKLHGLVAQHFALLFLITPALTATAFSEDKAKGILADLFTTSLTSTEIVLGKLLGRSLRAVEIVLYGLPVLCAAGAYVGLPLVFFVALLFVTLLVVLGVSSVGLVSAVMTRHVSGAVLATFLAVGVGALAVQWLPVPALEPFDTLAPCWGQADTRLLLQHLLQAALAWLALAAVCLGWAVWRLRPDGLRQTSGSGGRRIVRAPDRPPVGADPIRWKEYHIEGLAVLPALRRVPRWLGVLVVGLLSAAVSVSALAEAHLSRPRSSPDPSPFITQAFVFVLVTTLVVIVRSASAVSGERERQTWDSLCLTRLDGPTFLDGKLRGILDAALPYYGAYAVPALMLSTGAGVAALIATLLSVVMAAPIAYYAAACGLRASVFARSTWRGLVSALITVFFTALGVSLSVSAAMMCCTLCLLGGARHGEPLTGVLMAIESLVGCSFLLAALGKAEMRRAAARAFAIPKEPIPKEVILDLLLRRAKGQRDA